MILSVNPLTIARDKIVDISVLETIKEGQSVFKLDIRKAGLEIDRDASPTCARHFVAFRAATLTQKANSPLVEPFGPPPHFHPAN